MWVIWLGLEVPGILRCVVEGLSEASEIFTCGAPKQKQQENATIASLCARGLHWNRKTQVVIVGPVWKHLAFSLACQERCGACGHRAQLPEWGPVLAWELVHCCCRVWGGDLWYDLTPPISFFQMEIDNGDELTADFLYEEVHPKQHAHKQSFPKPKGPAGKRGIRRLIRGPAETEATAD